MPTTFQSLDKKKKREKKKNFVFHNDQLDIFVPICSKLMWVNNISQIRNQLTELETFRPLFFFFPTHNCNAQTQEWFVKMLKFMHKTEQFVKHI